IKTSINLEGRTSVSTLGKITSTFIKTARIYFLIRAVFIIMALIVSFVVGLCLNALPTEDICDYSSHRKALLSFVVDVNCDVTSTFVALLMEQVTCPAAARIHFAFRGRLLSLLVLIALRGLIDAFPPAGVSVYTGCWYSICR